MSVATEYSLKFDESMTEDEIEERSFRSLLPSESHRRGTLENKQSRHESEEEPAPDMAVSLDSSKVKTCFSLIKSCVFGSLHYSWSYYTIPSPSFPTLSSLQTLFMIILYHTQSSICCQSCLDCWVVTIPCHIEHCLLSTSRAGLISA